MAEELAVIQNRPISVYDDTARFELAERAAKLMSECTLMPPHFRGEKNVANCFVAMQLCRAIGEEPFLIMQKMYVVHDRLGIESQLAIAMINKSGFFRDRINFRPNGKSGDAHGWIAFATDKSGVVREEECTIAMAKAKGWWGKSNSNWPSMPDLMCKYRAAMILGRLHCPEALMGMQTREELLDMGEAEVILPGKTAADLDAALSADVEVKEATIVKQPKKPSKAKEKPDAVDSTPEPEKVPQTPSIDQIEADYKTWDEGKQAAFVDLVKTYKETMPREDAAVKAYLELA